MFRYSDIQDDNNINLINYPTTNITIITVLSQAHFATYF